MVLFECAICHAIAGFILVAVVGLVVVLRSEPFDRHWDC
jgi:hypothetical protein